MRKPMEIPFSFQVQDWWLWMGHNTASRRASGMWRAICACVDKFKQDIYFKVGHGNGLRFWTDPWGDSTSFATRFLSLHRLSLSPDGFIFGYYYLSGEQIVWDIYFRRNLSEVEMDDFSHLLLLLNSVKIRTFENDYLQWWPASFGSFLVKSFYEWSNKCTTASFVDPTIWSSKAPPRAISFFWIAGFGENRHSRQFAQEGKVIGECSSFVSSGFKRCRSSPHSLPFLVDGLEA